MKTYKILLFVLFAATLVALTGISHASSQKVVVVLNLDEEIDPGSGNFIASSLSSLTPSTTEAVIINTNTPGGILENMLQMVNAINSTEARGINVYTYIPADGMGASAGSYVAMATDGIYMGSGSYIGPSTPIVEGGTALEEKHTTDAMAALMGSMAIAHNRNATAAENMVFNNTAYTETQAVSIHLVNGYSSNLTALITSLHLSSYPVVTGNPNFYDNFLSFLSNSTVDGIFILIGAIAILADLFHGTAILSAIGIILIALGLLGAEIIGASLVGIILLLVGAVLIIVEAKTGHGISLVAGVVTALIGTFLLASPYLSSNVGYSPAPYGVDSYIAAIAIGIIAVFFGFMIRRIAVTFRSRKFTGAETLIGRTANVKESLSPKGWISIDGVRWEAKTEDNSSIDKGQKVTVMARDGLVLIVKPISTEPQQSESNKNQ